jgi:putative peptidoglycan lipid II flippase
VLTSAIGVLRRRILNVHTDHKRIAKGAIVVSLFVFLGKGAGALKEMAIAYRYGVGSVVDAYQLALTLITWLPLTLTTELAILLVPLFVGMRNQKGDMSRFLRELEGLFLWVGAALTALLLLAWPLVARFAASNLSEETRTMCLHLLMGIAPVGILSFTVCITAARLQAHEKHINTLLESVPAIVLLGFILIVPNRDSLLPMMLGTSLGMGLQAAILRFIARKTDGLSAMPLFTLRSPHWRKTLHSIGILMVGGVIVGLTTPVDQYFLAHVGNGAIATFGYANRVLLLLLGMGALAISRAILPILAEMLARHDYTRARDTAFKWSVVMLAIGLACAAVSYFLAPYIITLLFQRGAFTSEDTANVTLIFRTGLIQLPFSFGALVIIQLLVSEARYRTLTWMAVISFAIKAGANVLLARTYGAQGVMLSTGLMTAVVFIFYLASLRAPLGHAK